MGSVKIGPVWYEVHEVPGLRNPVNDQQLNGRISENEAVIQLEAAMCEQAKRVTLWHEILHAIGMHSGHEFSEEQLEALAYGIMDALQANVSLSVAYQVSTNKPD
jgi:hypothetical protein